MKIKKKKLRKLLFIALVVLLVLILAYLYMIPKPMDSIKENETTNISDVTEIKDSNQTQLETDNQSKAVINQIVKEIRIDCLIGSEDLCYAEGDSDKGWVIGALDKEFVNEFKDKYGISSDIILITNGSLNLDQKEITVKEEDINNILSRLEEFSSKIRALGRKELNVEVAKFEFITLKSKDGEWYWQYAISDVGSNFPDGSERVLLNFDLE